ncbi:hypothetical protein Tco_1162911 [Tanacetum coccineum]
MRDYLFLMPTNPEINDLKNTHPTLEDIYQNSTDGIFTNSSYDDEGAVADFTNLETVVNVSPIPTSRINSSHPSALILGDPTSAVQTRSKVNKSSGAHAFVSYVQKQRRNNHKDFQHCLFACFLSQNEPKKILEALKDEVGPDIMFAICAVLVSGQSTTGGCQFFGRRLISYQCKKQTIVVTSTTEAEYVAAASCCGHHFIRDAYEKKLIQVLKIHTDLLTKAFDVSSVSMTKHLTSKVLAFSRGSLGFRESLRRAFDGTEALLLPTLFILLSATVSTDSTKPLKHNQPSPTQTSEVPLVPQNDPSPTHTSEVPVEPQTDSSPRPSPSTTIYEFLISRKFWWNT